jgi:hypothetical protein
MRIAAAAMPIPLATVPRERLESYLRDCQMR